MERADKEPQDKVIERKSAIGRAAATLFHQKGYLETSLQDISAAAGLSKGCIYYYFSNKHEILYFILDGYMNHLADGLEEELNRIPDTASKIRFIMLRHLGLYNNRVPEAKAILHDAHNLPAEYYKAIALKQKRYAQKLADVLWEFFEGRMPMDKSKAIGYILFGMCNSIMHWHNPEGPIKLDELSGVCHDIFMRGIVGCREDREKSVGEYT